MIQAEHTTTILIVDDEETNVHLLSIMLAGQGYQLYTAYGGAQALTLAQELKPDLILLDVMMPDISGYDVCQRLRTDAVLAEVPIIFVTSLYDQDSRLKAIEAGGDDFISKPINKVELRKRVQTITRLDRYRQLLIARERQQQAEHALQHRNRELTLLNHVLTTVTSTLDVHKTLATACEALSMVFSFVDYVAATLYHGDVWLPQPIITYGTNPLSCVAAPDDTASWVMSLPMHSDSMTKLHRHTASCGKQTIAVLVVPLVVRHSTSGSIELYFNEECVFSQHDVSLVESVALAVGQALETILLYQNVQRHADVLEDVVAQRTTELRLERDRTRAILEAVGEAVVVINLDGMIEYMNPATVMLTGYHYDEAIGKPCWMWIQHSTPHNFCTSILQSVRDGTMWRGEIINQRRDGTSYDTIMTIAPLFHPDTPQLVVGFVSVQRDITPIKETSRIKEQFVSNVSHELRTPLSVMTLLSGNLDTLYPQLNDDKRCALIRDLRTQTRLLNDIVEDVLEISRIDSHTFSTTFHTIHLATIVQEEIQHQRTLAQQKQQHMYCIGDKNVLVYGNKGQLRQVVRNVLSNAIKYTPENGTIQCEYRLLSLTTTQHNRTTSDILHWPGVADLPAGTWAAFRVHDTGIGIDAADLPHVFERFYRVTTQTNIPGTGLGLSIARELIMRHQGHIAIHSQQGVGTTIACYIPTSPTSVPTHS